MTYVVLEIRDGFATGPIHKPSEKTGSRLGGGTTFTRHLERHDGKEMPQWWATECGRQGRVYVDAPVIRSAFTPCPECNP